MTGAVTGAVDETVESLTARIETFVREVVVPYERHGRRDDHGPGDDLVAELRDQARQAGLLTPHIREGAHLTQRQTARVLTASGLSPLGPVALNTGAPDEGNMYLLGRVATDDQKRRYLIPLIEGRMRSAFLMTEPAVDGGAGSDPSMLRTTAVRDGPDWIITGEKAFITGYVGAGVGIVMARTSPEGAPVAATMFLVDLPHPAITVDRIEDTIDSAMPGGHARLSLRSVRVSPDRIPGAVDEGFAYARIRLSPARLSHCMRWLGACRRAQEIATDYAVRRQAFGRTLIDHEGVGFMLVDNLIDLKQAELMIDWCADVLDGGALGMAESSMTKVAVSDALFRVADRCVQVMGGAGVSRDTIVEQVFREMRAFRIYDGPTEVHKWSLARTIKREAGLRA